MRFHTILTVLTLLLCSACSVKVLPVATATGTIDPVAQSITESRDGVAFTVKIDELNLTSQPLVDNITSFYVEIDNRTDRQLSFPPQNFLLKDSSNRQYRSIAPERVREIVSKDTVYLIPYPYVGYYYLKDQFRASHDAAFSSSLPFYAEYHPQEIFTRALPEEPILKGSKVAGVVYFIADLVKTDSVELLLFANDNLVGDPLVRFPFAVEK